MSNDQSLLGEARRRRQCLWGGESHRMGRPLMGEGTLQMGKGSRRRDKESLRKDEQSLPLVREGCLMMLGGVDFVDISQYATR